RIGPPGPHPGGGSDDDRGRVRRWSIVPGVQRIHDGLLCSRALDTGADRVRSRSRRCRHPAARCRGATRARRGRRPRIVTREFVMAGPIDAALRKFHLSLNVADLGRSIAFYRVLFGLEPAKVRSDYAKFELAEPPLVLSLIPGRPGAGGHL